MSLYILGSLKEHYQIISVARKPSISTSLVKSNLKLHCFLHSHGTSGFVNPIPECIFPWLKLLHVLEEVMSQSATFWVVFSKLENCNGWKTFLIQISHNVWLRWMPAFDSYPQGSQASWDMRHLLGCFSFQHYSSSLKILVENYVFQWHFNMTRKTSEW